MNFIDENEKSMSNLLDIENSISNDNFSVGKEYKNQINEDKESLLLKMKALSKTMKDYEIKKKNKNISLLLSNMINVETGEDNSILYGIENHDELFNNEDGITKEELKQRISQFSPRVENKKDIILKNEKTDQNSTLNWYIKISWLPVFFISLFNFLLLLIDHYVVLGNKFATNFVSLYLWKMPFEIFVFLLLSVYISRKIKQTPVVSGLACAFVGFESGVIIALMQLFFYRDMWNIFNLSLEGIFLAVNGAVVGFILGAIFFEVKK
ncbi:MAG: hypothetical protein PHZ07_01955 [Patescibacteria group bacterium]|nr:hypothetical protein [Patescibacteria group bacterium]MDD4304050.1 hypothetical protein [Patescibacteria group bacterium]MDD4694927.1 hypothetical protein [Patescibacteria group bacterium]